ncbi:hypothetical protein ACM66B_003613 [Microbotryomycetes sp. NB124-2]
MGRPLFSSQCLEAMQHDGDCLSSHGKQLASALEHAANRQHSSSDWACIARHADDNSDHESIIEEQFIDPNCDDYIKIKVRGLTQHLSPLASQVVQELPTEVLKLATRFEEVVGDRQMDRTRTVGGRENDVVTVKIHYKGGETGQCSVRTNGQRNRAASSLNLDMPIELESDTDVGRSVVRPSSSVGGNLGTGWTDFARRHSRAQDGANDGDDGSAVHLTRTVASSARAEFSGLARP